MFYELQGVPLNETVQSPLTSLELLNYYITLAMTSGRFAHYVIQRNDTTNNSIFKMSDGIQEVCSKMLGVVSILFLVS